MNRLQGGKPAGEGNEASPLSLLVHAADSHRPSAKGRSSENGMSRGDEAASIEEQLVAQRHAAARAEALHHQGLLSQLRGGGGLDGDFFSQNAAFAAAHQQQAAALALASDIRTAVAAAQLRQAAQFQNQDLLLARSAALQQLGLGGGVEQLQHELELQRLEELERRQLLAAAASGGPIGASLGGLSNRQHQFDLHEAQLRQDQFERPFGGASGESLIDRAGLRTATGEGSGARTGSSANEKDCFQKTPGSVVVPCRARGMPMDHNFKTAYFVIPENVEHGEELICSYFACRNAGIKFRYCTHCKVPVAKRNFRKRHKHGKPSVNDPDDDDDVDDDDEVVATKPIGESSEGDGRKRDVAGFDMSGNREMGSIQEAKRFKRSSDVDIKSEPPSLPPISHQTRPRIGAERERIWAQLLTKRPPTKNGEAVSAWLMEVLSVSDLDTPLKEVGKINDRDSISVPFKTGDAAQIAASVIKKTQPEEEMPKGDENYQDYEDDDDDYDDDDEGDEDEDVDEEDEGIEEDDEAIPEEKEAREESPPKFTKPAEPPRKVGSTEDSAHAEHETIAEASKKDVGSFAEWKDRKKNKGLPKKGFSMQPGSQAEEKPGSQDEGKPGLMTEEKPDLKVEETTGSKTEEKPDLKVEDKKESKTEEKPDLNVEEKLGLQTEEKPHLIEENSDLKTKQEPEPDIEKQPDGKPEEKPKAQAEVHLELMTEGNKPVKDSDLQPAGK